MNFGGLEDVRTAR